MYFLTLLLFLQGPSDIISGVERTFARMNDLSADFSQTSKDVLNRKQSAVGHVYLKRGKMARAEVTPPAPSW